MKPSFCQSLILGKTEAEDTGIVHLTSVNWNLHVAFLCASETNKPDIWLVTPGDQQQHLRADILRQRLKNYLGLSTLNTGS